MVVWVFILFVLSFINFIYDLLLWRQIIKEFNIFYITFFDIIFLLITLGMLYRMHFLTKKGEKEQLRKKIQELEDEIKKLRGE